MNIAESRAKAKRIEETTTTPGWGDIMAILDEMVSESQRKVMHLITSDPDKLTGKTAIRHASRSKALTDFKEAVYDASKILSPNPTGRGEQGG